MIGGILASLLNYYFLAILFSLYKMGKKLKKISFCYYLPYNVIGKMCDFRLFFREGREERLSSRKILKIKI